MQINQITVGWSETCSLPGYDNVKPSITLTATLADDDNPTGCAQLLMEQAKREVQELINQAQENAGETPKYYTGPISIIYSSYERKCFIIVHERDRETCPDDFLPVGREGRESNINMVAKKFAAGRGDGWLSFNCMNGDFSLLPPLPEPKPQPTPTPEDIPF